MFAYSCSRSKGFIREVLPNALVLVGLVRPLIRSALSLPKNCSSKVKPAPGTCSRASFSIDPNEKDALLHVPVAGLTFVEQFFGRDKADRISGLINPTNTNSLGNTSRNNHV